MISPRRSVDMAAAIRKFVLACLVFPVFAADINDIAAKCPGTVSLYAKNLDNGNAFGIREDERVRTASTIKLPIMAGVFAAVKDGNGSFSDQLEITAGEKVSGSGVLRGFSNGVKLPLRDVVLLMIILSDNTATNMILERYPADLINAYLTTFGLHETKALRKILGDGGNLKPVPTGQSKEGRAAAYRRFGIGVSTAREMVALLEKLETGSVVSPDASREMISVLSKQQDQAGMQRKLPYRIASKSGALDTFRSDVGIVYSPAGRVAMAITVDGMPSQGYKPDHPGLHCIANLSEALVEKLTAKI